MDVRQDRDRDVLVHARNDQWVFIPARAGFDYDLGVGGAGACECEVALVYHIVAVLVWSGPIGIVWIDHHQNVLGARDQIRESRRRCRPSGGVSCNCEVIDSRTGCNEGELITRNRKGPISRRTVGGFARIWSHGITLH